MTTRDGAGAQEGAADGAADGADRAPGDGQELLAEPLRSRWSPSVFDPEATLTRAEVTALLQAARWAPTCGNAQPFHAVVAERGSASHAVLVRHLSRGNAGWVPRASVVFVVGAQVAPDEDGEGGYKPFHAGYDTGQAAAHLTVQAHAMGLSAHQFAGFDKDAVAAELGVPAYVTLMAGIAVGRRGDPALDPEQAARETKPRRRRPLDRTAYGARWGEPW